MRNFETPGRSAVLARNGMVATSHPLGAQAALVVLQQGGNAVDAAIAGAVLLGICEPQMTGLGGDCFVLLKPAGSDDIVALNGSGRAPAGFDANLLRKAGHSAVPKHDVAACTVPGAVDAFCKLSTDWGTQPLADVLAPAIRYAREGVVVAPRVAFDWHNAQAVPTGAARQMFLKDGKALKQGDIFSAPGQAEALERIATHGRAGFYDGPVADDMVASLKAAGGTHTHDDFAATDSTYGVPISGTYGDLEVVEHPPNGQGATALLLLNILKHFDIAGMNPLGAQRAHIEAEATKLAYDARNRLMAEDTPRMDHLLSADTAAQLAALIDPARAMADPAPLAEMVHRDTIYITVVDKQGMAVSLIYSIFSAFGSGIASDKYGILFHNRGAGFNLTPGHINEAAPGKRPLHTILPGMVRKEGRVIMPFGVMGGAYQANGHARFISNTVDFGMSPQAAIDLPRSFPTDGALTVESGYAETVRVDLAARGHTVAAPPEPIGGAQAILIHDDGTLEGGSDPRKDGCALGY